MIFRILEDQFARKIRETKDADRRFMELALALGRRGQGRTWPNPAVGCVLVNGAAHMDGVVLAGRAAHAITGRVCARLSSR